MNTRDPVRVVLELKHEHEQHTISGRIAVNNNPESGFYGWLELIHKLHLATDSASPDTGGPAMASESRRSCD
jgi:hypothetical protein